MGSFESITSFAKGGSIFLSFMAVKDILLEQINLDYCCCCCCCWNSREDGEKRITQEMNLGDKVNTRSLQ